MDDEQRIHFECLVYDQGQRDALRAPSGRACRQVAPTSRRRAEPWITAGPSAAAAIRARPNGDRSEMSTHTSVKMPTLRLFNYLCLCTSGSLGRGSSARAFRNLHKNGSDVAVLLLSAFRAPCTTW